MKHILSARHVQTAAVGTHPDGEGLYLVVTESGASWAFRFTSPSGRRREMGLGRASRSSLAAAGQNVAAARAACERARALLIEGKDPIEERKARRVQAEAHAAEVKGKAKAERTTLARCARDYHARVIEATRTEKHATQWLSSLENHVPPRIWHKPIADIEAPELLEALLAIKPHERARNLSQGARVQETVQRIRQRLDAVFEDASFQGHCASNPAAAVKRKLREGLPRRRKGQFAALPYAEVPSFMKALRTVEGIAARCLEFGLLTVARTGELIECHEAELNLDQALWTIPGDRMKAGEEHTVYLSAQAVRIAREQLALERPANAPKRWLFPSPQDLAKTMSNMGMLALLKRMGYRDRTTVHGLCRAAFSTWAYETNAARPDVIEACLAHSEEDRVKAAYNRAKFSSERRALLIAWANYCYAECGAEWHADPSANQTLRLLAA